MVKYNDEMDEVMNLGLDDDPEVDWLKTFEMSREIEQAFRWYEMYEISLFNDNVVLLQISDDRIVVGNLLKYNFAILKGIKASDTISERKEKT